MTPLMNDDIGEHGYRIDGIGCHCALFNYVLKPLRQITVPVVFAVNMMEGKVLRQMHCQLMSNAPLTATRTE